MRDRFPYLPWLAAAMCVCGIAACGSTSPVNVQLTRNTAAQISRVQVRQSVTEVQTYTITNPADTASAHASAPATGNLMAAVIGHLVAETLIQNDPSLRTQHQDPLLEFTNQFDFATPFRERFDAALAASDWLQPHSTSHFTFPATAAEHESFLKGARGEAALFSDTRYHFSGDYRRLYVATTTELWPRGDSMAPIHRAKYLFCSDAVGATDDSMESYLAQWSARNGVRLRETLHQGIAENVRMLSRGLFLRAAIDDSALTTAPTEISLNECGIAGTVSGWVVAAERHRLLARSSIGDYYSIPRADANPAEIDALRTKSYRADAIPLRQGL